MPVSVIPAPDNSGMSQGLAILSAAIEANKRRQWDMARDQAANLENLRANAPKLPEDQQNALLNIPPAQFKQRYGVDIDTVAPINKETGKRLFIAYPQGTPEEQKQRAELAQTQQATATSKAQQGELEAITKSTNETSARETTKLARTFGDNYRTPDGKRLTFAQQVQLANGDPNAPEVQAVSEYGKQIEDLSQLLGGEVGSKMVRDAVLRDETMKNLGVDKLSAEIRNIDALTALYGKQQEALDKKTPTGALVDDKFAQQTASKIQEVANGLTSQFSGIPTEALSAPGALAKAWAFMKWSMTPGLNKGTPGAGGGATQDSDRLAGLLFGPVDGVGAYVESLRKDLGGGKSLTVSVPSINKDGKMTIEKRDLLDPTVQENLKYIRRKTAELAPLVDDMMSADPTGRRLAALAALNPIINKAVQTMRPDIYKQIIDAKGNIKGPDAFAAPQAAGDPNLSALGADSDAVIQKQIDDIRRSLGDALPGTMPLF